MEYLLLILATALLLCAYANGIKYRKLKNSGKIPRILTARRNITVYLILALTTISAYIFILGTAV
jgi:hypothetical protein